VLVTLDADLQHSPEDIRGMVGAFEAGSYDLLIGSRFIEHHDYAGTRLGRRMGMWFFSILGRLLTGQRVYDTSSGLKIVRRRVFGRLMKSHFVDFHVEAIVYLVAMGYRVGEYPVTVAERTDGLSMYGMLSHIKYPLKTTFMAILAVFVARIDRGENK